MHETPHAFGEALSEYIEELIRKSLEQDLRNDVADAALREDDLEQRNAEWLEFGHIINLYLACNFPRRGVKPRIPWYTSGFQ